MTKKTILLAPTGSVSKEDKKQLFDEGYLLIEVADPTKIKSVSQLGLIGTDDISIIALDVLNELGSQPTITNGQQDVLNRFTKSLLNKSATKNRQL